MSDFHNDGFGGGNDGFGGGNDDSCFNCGQPGHREADCPEPPKAGGLTGGCFNCGEIGHNKADCTNPRVERPFTGACHKCGEDGHRASECPSAPPRKCRACGEEGHESRECNNARNIYDESVPTMAPTEAWTLLVGADNEKDIIAFKDAMNAYTKAMPDMTFQQMEKELRAAKMNIYLVAKEQEIADTMTIVNLQGKKDCKYVVSFQLSYKPTRPKFMAGWPKTAEENMERLQDAGYVRDSFISKCRNCGEMGHISKACTQDKVEIEKPTITCPNCKESGHYVRDCPQPRQDRNTCRNCGQPGHKASDCTEERSAANVECRHCNEMGHFAKDCPTREPQTCRNCGQEGHRKAECPEPPKSRACRNCGAEDHMARECPEPANPDNIVCNNCDEKGHIGRECPEPRDYSRVTCRNCGEKGHTVARCKKPVEGADDVTAGVGGLTVGGGDDWTNGNAVGSVQSFTGSQTQAVSAGGADHW